MNLRQTIIPSFFGLLLWLLASGAGGTTEPMPLERILDGAERAERAFGETVHDYVCQARTTISEPQKDGTVKTIRLIEKTIYRKLPDRRVEKIHSIIESDRVLSEREVAEYQEKHKWNTAAMGRHFFSSEQRCHYIYELLPADTIKGIPAHVLRLWPRREEENLVTGTIWLRQDNFEILQMDIRPVQRPRFVKELHMFITFGEVGKGIWLPVQVDVDACGGLLFFKKCLTVHEAWDRFQINSGLPDSIFVRQDS
jgi:hypothetical protein